MTGSDGAAPREQEIRTRRFLDLTTRADGTGRLAGELTREAAAALAAVLDPLSAPAPAGNGVMDPRTAGQRRHDGLLDACTRLLDTGALPDAGGVPATILLTIDTTTLTPNPLTAAGLGAAGLGPASGADCAAGLDSVTGADGGGGIGGDARNPWALDPRNPGPLDPGALFGPDGGFDCPSPLELGARANAAAEPDAPGFDAIGFDAVNRACGDGGACSQSPAGRQERRPDRARPGTGRPPGGPLGFALTPAGGLIPLPAALRLADQAEIYTLLRNPAGGITAMTSTRRLATPAQRRALAARDRGCSFPDCTRPAAWCQAHHITAWTDGGPTTLDNLTLLCGFHHREFDRLGWTCRMHPADKVPEWIPPPELDPDQNPRRNTAHNILRI